MLVLRTCDKDLKSHNGFQWPESGPVEAPDWNSIQMCGNGLHGLANGVGNSDLLCWDLESKWLVVDVPEDTVVNLDGKVKFPRGNVVHCGTRKSATQYLYMSGCRGPIVGLVWEPRHLFISGPIHGGNRSEITSRRDHTVITGDNSIAVSGDRGTALSGNDSVSVTGGLGVSKTGYRGVAISGVDGTSHTRVEGVAISDDFGTSITGARGWAVVGKNGCVTINDEIGFFMAGLGSVIRVGNYKNLLFVDGKNIQPNVPYSVSHNRVDVVGLWGGISEHTADLVTKYSKQC